MSSWLRKFDPRSSSRQPESLRQFFSKISKSSVAKQIAVGTAGGWCSGFLFRKVGKFAALAVGGGILILQVAAHQGYIKIDWTKVDKGVDAVQSETAVQDTVNTIEDFIRNNMFLSSAYAGGFLIGLAVP